MHYLNVLKRNLWTTALVCIAVYFVLLALPAINNPNAFGRGASLIDADFLISKLPVEMALAVSVLILLRVLGVAETLKSKVTSLWDYKLAIIPAVFSLLVLLLVVSEALSGDVVFSQIISTQSLILLVLTTFLVGVFEEGLFRGLALSAAMQHFKPVTAVFITSALFGVMHLVNYVNGQPLDLTAAQVVHAFVLGVMYGMLVLRLGSLWPVILLHGLWDAAVSMVGNTLVFMQTDSVPQQGLSAGSFLIMLPEFFYALFLLWSVSRWMKRQPLES